eukprot:UN25864
MGSSSPADLVMASTLLSASPTFSRAQSSPKSDLVQDKRSAELKTNSETPTLPPRSRSFSSLQKSRRRVEAKKGTKEKKINTSPRSQMPNPSPFQSYPLQSMVDDPPPLTLEHGGQSRETDSPESDQQDISGTVRHSLYQY